MVLSLAFILAFIGAAVALLVGILIFSEVAEAMALTLPVLSVTTTPDSSGFLVGVDQAIKRFSTNSSAGSTCPLGSGSSDIGNVARKILYSSSTSGICKSPTYTFDLTSIPNNPTVTSMTLRIDVLSNANAQNAQIFQVTKDTSTLTDAEGTDTVFKRGGAGDFSGTTYISNDPFTTTNGQNKLIVLPTTAHTDLEADLSSTRFILALNYQNPIRVAGDSFTTFGDTELEVNFTTITIVPFTAGEQQEIDTFNNALNIGFTVIGILPVALFFALFAIFSGRIE